MGLTSGKSPIIGGTDNTNIGNTGNKLNVEANLVGGAVTTLSSKLRYDDMNASSGGIARGTTITSGAAAITIYSYSGSGNFLGFLLNLEASSTSANNWQVNLIIDGEEIFNSSGINTTDFINATLYNYSTGGAREPSALGIEMVGDALFFSTSGIYPIKFNSSVRIKIKKTNGGDKKFNAGLVLITRET